MNPKHASWQRAACAAVLLAALSPLPAAAQETGGAPGDWLSHYAGARTVGLGGAFVAAGDNAFGALWNPANLSLLYQNELLAETSRLYEGTAVNGLSFAVPGHKLPSFGITITNLRSGDFERTNEMNDNLGTFNESEMAILFTASKSVSPRFALGTNLKMVRQSLEDFSAGGFGVDLGGSYDVSPTLRVAASMLNLGGPSVTLRDTKETYPFEVRGGFAATVLGGRGLLVGQLDQLSGQSIRVHGGGEYWIQPQFALRAGYDASYPAAGFSYRMSNPLQLDYGIADDDLGMTHRVGISYRFGGFFASSQAEPAVFSPTGENAVTKIQLKAHTKADASEWSLELKNKSEEVVRRFGGKGLPPSHLEWDGKDETGLPLADGFYHYQLVVIDTEGRRVEGPVRKVEIMTSGPQGSVPVIPAK